MRALLVEEFGGPEKLIWSDHPAPEPRADETLIRVGAVAVDWADVIQREGRYPGGPVPPFVVSTGYAGTVLESADPGLPPGTRVFGLARGGAAAELIAVPRADIFPTPDHLSDAEAAGIVGQFFTADVATRVFGRVRAGDAVLVQAGGGSLGTAAIQLCRTAGARTIIATAGNPEKFAIMGELGATHCIDYRQESIVDRVAEITEGHGVDLVIESVGGDVLADSLDCVAVLGRIVSVGASSGKSTSRFRLHTLFEKNISVAGFTLGAWLTQRRPDVWTDVAGHVLALMESKELRAVVGRVFSVAEAAAAHEHLTSRLNVGRTVLTIP